MADKRIVEYLKLGRKRGIPFYILKIKLLEKGHSIANIEEAAKVAGIKNFQNKYFIILIAVLAILFFLIVSQLGKKAVHVKQTIPESHSINVLLSGNVISISPAEMRITLGTYRLENNKPELVSQQTVLYAAETTFVRVSPSINGSVAESTTSINNVHLGDLVTVFPTIQQRSDKIIAAKIIILNLPAPPPIK